MTVRPIRKFTKTEAFVQLKERTELARNVSAAARVWGCSRDTARRWIAEFTVSPSVDGVATGSPTVPIPASPPSSPWWRSDMMTFAAYAAAVALASCAAVFSLNGMRGLFPGWPDAVFALAIVMEATKLIAVAWLSRHWRRTWWFWRLALVAGVVGLAAINATGVYSQLVAAHLGDRATGTSAVEIQTATTGAMIRVQTDTIADLDRRLDQIDAAIAEMTKRGRSNGALGAIQSQRKAREALVAERRHEADILTKLKTEQAEVAARARAVEVENAPIRYVAELIGGTTEEAIRMLILMMVLCCDPLAIALTAAAAARSKEGIA
jgi:hypothetical protein